MTTGITQEIDEEALCSTRTKQLQEAIHLMAAEIDLMEEKICLLLISESNLLLHLLESKIRRLAQATLQRANHPKTPKASILQSILRIPMIRQTCPAALQTPMQPLEEIMLRMTTKKNMARLTSPPRSNK